MYPWDLIRAVRILDAGGVLGYPTEAVYGLGCGFLQLDTLEHLISLKRRPAGKGFIIIAAEPEQLQPLVDLLVMHRRREILASWPGPVTWVLRARAGVPESLCGPQRTVAVRVTGHPIAAELCRRAGPIISTSANPAGHPPARSAAEVRRYFGRALDFVLEGPLGGAGRPSEVRDGCDGRVLRSA